MTNTDMINAKEIAKKFIRKEVVLDMQLDKIKADYETANINERTELLVEAKVNRASYDAYRDMVSDLVASPKWRILTYREIKVEMMIESL